MIEILALAEEMTGNPDQALAWFRCRPIAAHGGQTALELVSAGHAAAILAHLEDLQDGMYA